MGTFPLDTFRKPEATNTVRGITHVFGSYVDGNYISDIRSPQAVGDEQGFEVEDGDIWLDQGALKLWDSTIPGWKTVAGVTNV